MTINNISSEPLTMSFNNSNSFNRINMVSSTMDIDNLSGVNSYSSPNTKGTKVTHKNLVRDSIALALEVSNRSGVPVLFLSNPGEGKTTGVKTFGRVHNMHVEFLMGSQYTQEDMLGFMTNTNKEYLEVKIPEWYYRIMEYTKYHWEIKGDPNFELGYTERKKLIEEKKLYISYKNNSLTEEQILDMDIPFDKIDIDARIKEIDQELEDKFVWAPPRGTILFLDELSAAAPTVQGALLRLCHERTLRGNNKLPKDCIVCAAGNFRRNLPSFMEIIAPELNRFCIINLLRGDNNTSLSKLGKELVSEATQDFYENTDNFPTYEDAFEFTEETSKNFLAKYRDGLIGIFEKYAGSDSPNGVLDLRNTNFDGMFDGTDNIPEISNFISIRSISYFARVLKALCELRVSNYDLDEIYKKFSVGLLGLGTNSWENKQDDRELQIKNYQQTLNYLVSDLLSEFNHPPKNSISLGKSISGVNMSDIYKDDGSLSSEIHNYINTSAVHGVDDPTLIGILNRIDAEFPKVGKDMLKVLEKIKTKDDIVKWRADYEAIKMLAGQFESSYDTYNSIYTSALRVVLNTYEFYYVSVISNIKMSDLKN